MNVKSIILFVVIAMAVTSCNSNKTKEKVQNTSDTVIVRIENGDGIATMYKDSMKSVFVCFNSGEYDYLRGKITTLDDNSNVRFNRITMPDGKMDGPFTRNIAYGLVPNSDYTLTIGENLMQGELWSGNMNVEVDLSNKVNYINGENYFVRNDYKPELLKENKILTQENFNQIFGMATTMNNKPTPIDFSKQFAIVVINKPTNKATKLSAESLTKKNNVITLTYSEDTGGEQSFSIQPFLLLIVDKSEQGIVSVEKVNIF